MMLNMSDVIRFNSTLTVWHEAIINGLSTKCNSLLYALEAVAAILLDGSAHVQVSVSDGYDWFGKLWRREDDGVQAALVLVSVLFCLPAILMIVQCFILPGKWSTGDRSRKHISQQKILNLHELAKTAYKEGHAEIVMEYIDEYCLDVNHPAPHTGLTMFLCACLSGHRRLVCALLKRGGDVSVSTSDKDSALYLATFGVLNSLRPDMRLLDDLINGGCSINCQNAKGFTPLHRAATRGNIPVINWLLQHGADRYLANNFGVYPIDSATNAGHPEVAMLLSIENSSSRVNDITEPRTPVRERLSMQNPRQKHVADSLKQLKSVKKKILKLITP